MIDRVVDRPRRLAVRARLLAGQRARQQRGVVRIVEHLHGLIARRQLAERHGVAEHFGPGRPCRGGLPLQLGFRIRRRHDPIGEVDGLPAGEDVLLRLRDAEVALHAQHRVGVALERSGRVGLPDRGMRRDVGGGIGLGSHQECGAVLDLRVDLLGGDLAPTEEAQVGAVLLRARGAGARRGAITMRPERIGIGAQAGREIALHLLKLVR